MAGPESDEREWRERASGLGAEILRCLRFYSRLPVPSLAFEPNPHGAPDASAMARILPLAGALIGLVPAAVLVLGLALGFGPWLSAALSVTALTLATGAMHDDGLADTTDGFGGGATSERRLAIMRDSRIGSFGASALILAFALRIGALAAVAARIDAFAAAVAVVLTASLSRTAGLVLLALLPPARPDGVSHAFGRPAREDLWIAAAVAGALTVLLGLPSELPVLGLVLMMGLSAAVAFAVARASERLIGGQTGDVVGASQPLAEVACLLGLLIGLGH
jgi:adenosylcobinamide-GDP ribazoletransferase